MNESDGISEIYLQQTILVKQKNRQSAGRTRTGQPGPRRTYSHVERVLSRFNICTKEHEVCQYHDTETHRHHIL